MNETNFGELRQRPEFLNLLKIVVTEILQEPLSKKYPPPSGATLDIVPARIIGEIAICKSPEELYQYFTRVGKELDLTLPTPNQLEQMVIDKILTSGGEKPS